MRERGKKRGRKGGSERGREGGREGNTESERGRVRESERRFQSGLHGQKLSKKKIKKIKKNLRRGACIIPAKYSW